MTWMGGHLHHSRTPNGYARTARQSHSRRLKQRPNRFPFVPRSSRLNSSRQSRCRSQRSHFGLPRTNVGVLVSAHWLRNQLLRASPVSPTAIVTLCAEVPAWSTPRMLALRCAERGTWQCSHSPLVAGYTPRPSHTDVGRCEAKCTGLRAHSH